MRLVSVFTGLILMTTSGMAMADSPLRSKKLKLASCESIAKDYHGHTKDIKPDECLKRTFNVVDSTFSEDIERTTYLKVVVTSADEVCTVEHKLQADLVDNKIKYHWSTDTLMCDYEGSENELLVELLNAVEGNDSIWGGEAHIFKIEGSIEKYIEDQLEDLEKQRDENPEMYVFTGASAVMGELMEDYHLGNCYACMKALKKIKKSGSVVNGIRYDNGSYEDYLETNIELILKDGSAFSIYFGN